MPVFHERVEAVRIGRSLTEMGRGVYLLGGLFYANLVGASSIEEVHVILPERWPALVMLLYVLLYWNDYMHLYRTLTSHWAHGPCVQQLDGP